MKSLSANLVVAAVLLACSACGGGGGSSSSANPPAVIGGGSFTGGYTPGTFMPSETFEAKCAKPRTGNDPGNGGRPFPDTQGSATSENNWLRSWTNETYLWYSEVTDLNPASYTTADYFQLQKTTAKTASGTDKDRFHFVMATDKWEQQSQSGVLAGYGAQWFLVSPSPPREIVVAYVDPGSPAATAGLVRGDSLVSVDGVDAINDGSAASTDKLNEAVFPDNPGETHQFTIRHLNGTTATVSLQSADVTSTPVQNVAAIPTTSGPVGYMLFNDHIATAESGLIAAINNLKAQNVTDLVLDIRYNGGGYLDIASELAFMIAGPARTAGQTFERLSFNDKNPTTDPVTGQALAPTPFLTTTQGFSTSGGVQLPTLTLNRVFVLTGSGTCSASESIINSLRGVDVTVIQIGGTTCGKPYGFYPTDNCGTTYFSIQFKGVNAKGFGEYTDGFRPENSVVTAGEPVTGCSVKDDFTHALGDKTEARLAAALNYRAGAGTCPTAPTGPVGLAKQQNGADASEGYLPKSPWRENRILRPAH
jgi:carboxyl-terminal processing protease